MAMDTNEPRGAAALELPVYDSKSLNERIIKKAREMFPDTFNADFNDAGRHATFDGVLAGPPHIPDPMGGDRRHPG
jgi:hypothetical protein